MRAHYIGYSPTHDEWVARDQGLWPTKLTPAIHCEPTPPSASPGPSVGPGSVALQLMVVDQVVMVVRGMPRCMDPDVREKTTP